MLLVEGSPRLLNKLLKSSCSDTPEFITPAFSLYLSIISIRSLVSFSAASLAAFSAAFSAALAFFISANCFFLLFICVCDIYISIYIIYIEKEVPHPHFADAFGFSK